MLPSLPASSCIWRLERWGEADEALAHDLAELSGNRLLRLLAGVRRATASRRSSVTGSQPLGLRAAGR